MPLALRLATFNLENLDDRPGLVPSLDDRIEVLRPQLLRLRADVLCLQEVNGQQAGRHAPRTLAALDRLLADSPYAHFARAATESRQGHGVFDVHNLVILSRFPIRATTQLRHELAPPPAYRLTTAVPAAGSAAPVEWDRPILHAELDLGEDRTLHVINVHLRAPLASFVPGRKRGAFAWTDTAAWAEGFFIASMKRAGQAFETRLLVDRIFDADRHALIAVCGDFNADLREVPVRMIVASEADTGSGDLAYRAMVPLEQSVPEAARYSVVHGGRVAMIDHVLVSRALLASYRGAEIHNEGLFDEVSTPPVERPPDSFHAPVVTEFVIP
ncbi:MAG: endonuclease/exonuclease/phosphatase family protein [Alphaproteobacteria bacterium]